MAAVVAWRVSVAGSFASDADRAALGAARQLSAEIVKAEGLVARTTEAWLDYERSRRRAEALEEAGFHADARRYRREATTHWFLVRPEYLDESAVYDADQHRVAVLQEAGSEVDLDPAPHLAVANAEYARIQQLLTAAFVIALALPLATLAELTSGRWRGVSAIAGSAVFAVGCALVLLAWP
jgi:hypothetical protein